MVMNYRYGVMFAVYFNPIDISFAIWIACFIDGFTVLAQFHVALAS
jgi:hypothetical protein